MDAFFSIYALLASLQVLWINDALLDLDIPGMLA